MSEGTSILLVGVGGQGTILAAKILSQVAMQQKLDVKMSEVHGMSQRGGSVITYVKFGPQVFSPLIEPGEADYIVSFEKLESLRWAHYLKPGGTLVVNEQEIYPLPVLTGAANYPDHIFDRLAAKNIKVVKCNAARLAEQCGNIKAANVVLMGVLAHESAISKQAWLEAIEQKVPARFLALNKAAFEVGYSLA
ncbi:MAG TPA: indolepyruvate oxidoreductase subunit beta [Desulfobacteria bacterium]|nr:indolepyruvate oxidoreductase subunit beta [Desulfobacteria bacterium]